MEKIKGESQQKETPVTPEKKLEHYRALYRDLLRRKREKKGYGMDAGSIVKGYQEALLEAARAEASQNKRELDVVIKDFIQTELDGFGRDRDYRKVKDQVEADFIDMDDKIREEIMSSAPQKGREAGRQRRGESGEPRRGKRGERAEEEKEETPPQTIEAMREALQQKSAPEYLKAKKAEMRESIKQDGEESGEAVREASEKLSDKHPKVAEALQKGGENYASLLDILSEYQAYEAMREEADGNIKMLEDFKAIGEMEQEFGEDGEGSKEAEALIKEQKKLQEKYKEHMLLLHDKAIDQWKQIETAIGALGKELQGEIDRLNKLLDRQVYAEHLQARAQEIQQKLQEKQENLQAIKDTVDEFGGKIKDTISTYGEASVLSKRYKKERTPKPQIKVVEGGKGKKKEGKDDEEENENSKNPAKPKRKKSAAEDKIIPESGDEGDKKVISMKAEKEKRKKENKKNAPESAEAEAPNPNEVGRGVYLVLLDNAIENYTPALEMKYGSFDILQLKAYASIERDQFNMLNSAEADVWKNLWVKAYEGMPEVQKKSIDATIDDYMRKKWGANESKMGDKLERKWALWELVYNNLRDILRGKGEEEEELKKAA